MIDGGNLFEAHLYDNQDCDEISITLNLPSDVLDEDASGTEKVTFSSTDDSDGEDALWFGGEYYERGMSCDDDHDLRIQYFQAAELLYGIASLKTDTLPLAMLCLGYIYYYDRCEGTYSLGFNDKTMRLSHAYYCFSKAAEVGIPEALYKCGDMLRDGKGCEPDPDEAFKKFDQAYRIDGGRRRYVWGSAAMRLGQCYEEGIGCPQSFESAAGMYQQAVIGLEGAVAMGDQWYERSLSTARAGLTRCRQELVGGF